MALELGPCRIYFGTAGAEADIGKTQGGVRITFSEDAADLMSDQYGTQPEDQVITGQAADVVVPMAEVTHANFAIALNQTSKQIGADSGVAGESLVGTKRSTKANSLLLKKYVNGSISADTDDWIRFPKASPLGNVEVAFDGANQRILEVTFKAFPDANSRLYFIGNEAASLTGS